MDVPHLWRGRMGRQVTEQQIDQQERELDYWMARAYEAEGKLWKAEARIRAVENVLDDGTWTGHSSGKDWVSATAIRRALEG